MKVRVVMQERMTLDQLANENDLLMLVYERPDRLIESGLTRFYAGFQSTEVKHDRVLISAQGQGNTPTEAIEDYIQIIRGELLIYKASGGSERREIKVPENLDPKFTMEHA